MTAGTTFTAGQLVRARVTAQGLDEGELYRIASVSVRETPLGGFVTYYVTPVDSASQAAKQQALPITNGHLVLEAA